MDTSLKAVALSRAVITRTRLPAKSLGGQLFDEVAAGTGSEVGFEEVKDTYLALKNNAAAMGDYDDMAWFYVKERQTEKCIYFPSTEGSAWIRGQLAAHRDKGYRLPLLRILSIVSRIRLFLGIFAPKEAQAKVQRTAYLRDWLDELVTGYSTRPEMVIVSWFVVTIAFAFIYLTMGTVVENRAGADNRLRELSELPQSFVFSLANMTTVSLPNLHGEGLATNALATLQGLIGLVFLVWCLSSNFSLWYTAGMRTSRRITIRKSDRVALERLAQGRNTPQKVALRAKIVLLSGTGTPTGEIMQALDTTTPTISLWRNRYVAAGVAGLVKDATRPGRNPSLSQATVQGIVELTLREPPADATHWSTRSMARVAGVSPATVQRIWKAHGLQPHRVRTFKLSRDPQFLEKLHDIVGLYVDPPKKALVFSVDEKSQIQALDRTQPGLPMKRGRAGTMTHDYKRNGTTTLFAALNVLTGDVIGQCTARHRHDEFLRFLKKIDRETPATLDLHLIVDNYATHKHAAVERWLRRHPRVHLHFTPTSASWLNLVERFFAELTQKRLRRGVFRTVRELVRAIYAYLAQRNKDPHPFLWTASVQAILQKVSRAKEALDALH